MNLLYIFFAVLMVHSVVGDEDELVEFDTEEMNNIFKKSAPICVCFNKEFSFVDKITTVCNPTLEDTNKWGKKLKKETMKLCDNLDYIYKNMKKKVPPKECGTIQYDGEDIKKPFVVITNEKEMNSIDKGKVIDEIGQHILKSTEQNLSFNANQDSNVIPCLNLKSCRWLRDIVPTLKPWDEAKLRPLTWVATVSVVGEEQSIFKEGEITLKQLNQQNSQLHTIYWRKISENQFLLDDISSNTLKDHQYTASYSSYQLHFKLESTFEC